MPGRKKAPNRVDELLDELLGENPRPESILGESGLLKQLSKRLIERALAGELSHHLKQEAEQPLEPGRNSRNGYSQKTLQTDQGEMELSIPESCSTQVDAAQSELERAFAIPEFITREFANVNPTQVNPTEIPLTSSISLQQFLSSHNFALQNTTIPTWLSSLGGTTPFNLNIEVRDLPTGQLAEAQVTGFAADGTPNAGTLLLPAVQTRRERLQRQRSRLLLSATAPLRERPHPLGCEYEQPATLVFP